MLFKYKRYLLLVDKKFQLELTRMLNKFSKIILLFAAYLPLFWIIAIYHFPTIISFGVVGEYIIWGVIIFTISILILVKFMLRTVQKVRPNDMEIEIKESKNTEIIAFFVSYLYGIFPSRFDIYAILTFFLVFFIIAYIYLTTDMISVNPILNIIFRYNLYNAVNDQEKILILTKNKYVPKQYTFKLYKILPSIFIEFE